jgi:hypoxanthine phosphoribosyltransferase
MTEQITQPLRKFLADDVQEVLYTPDQIQVMVDRIGEQITRDYTGRNPLLVGVLKGVLFFMADLVRAIPIPLEVDFMAVSNYSPEARQRGVVRVVKDLEIPLTDRHVLFVEDMVDTGLTLNYLLQNLRTRDPASLEVCTLFSKPDHRLMDIPIKYRGFNLPDRFVVGYGLDCRERYRNLPFVGILKEGVVLEKGGNPSGY